MMQKKNSHFIRNWLLLVFLLVIGLSSGGLWYWNVLQSPVSNDNQVKAFVIQKGEGASSVADRLEQEGLIRSALAFKWVYRSGDVPKIEAGTFTLSPSMSLPEIMKALEKGAVDKWVTILEGWRIEQIAERVNQELGIDKGEFLKYAKEGYMFPDTYLFNQEATAQTVASTLRNTFEQRYNAELRAKIKKQGLTPEEGVILASLVEREGRSDKVRTEVAGIMLRRLKMKMKLDIDATVQYAKDSQKLKQNSQFKDFWKPILQADYTEVISSYNTYLNNGLPPAPICNPSMSSLNAVANANPNTPYLYYFHDTQGNSYYGRTLEEHNINVARNR